MGRGRNTIRKPNGNFRWNHSLYSDINGWFISDKHKIGYCCHMKHKGYVSPKILREHGCLEKNCPMLKRFEEKTFWKQLEAKRLAKEKRKEEKRNKKNNA